MRKSNKLTSALISLLSVAVLTTTATFAWFFMNSDVEVEYGNDIICETGTALEVSIYQGRDEQNNEVWTPYSSKAMLNSVTARLEDISGDGINLYRAVTLIGNDQGQLVPSDLMDASPANSEGFGEFLELKIRLRSSSPMDVYLGGDSKLLPKYTGENHGNIFGDFSMDYIAGAMRVAVLENEELKMLWAPNPNYELVRSDKDGSYTFKTDGQVETYKYYKYVDEENDLFELVDVPADDLVYKKFVFGSTNTTDSMINGSPLLTTIEPDAVTGFGVSTLTLRLWFEGTDREADQALSGGSTKLNLKFSGIEPKPYSNELETTINKITANKTITTTVVDEGLTTEHTVDVVSYPWKNIDNSIKNTLMFTLDGYKWTTYDPSNPNLPDIQNLLETTKKDVVVYLKIPESSNYLEVVRKMVFEYEEEEESGNE
jgi:hypothetical protein